MALNPAYDQQSTRKLPFALGYVYCRGDQVAMMSGFDNTSEAIYILGEGEWDGPQSFAPTDTFPLTQIGPLNAVINTTNPFFPIMPSSTMAHLLAIYLHFHGGSYGAKGLPLNLSSVGPEQQSDTWYQYFPSVTPPLNLSGLAYYFVRLVNPSAGPSNAPGGTINPVGVWRSTRCRIFDASGNVTGYGFTVNPTWQMIETILRFQVKPQQPPLAGLTNAEKALFDWPAMVAHAARNATVVPSGAPRFCGNFMFASDAKLGGMMETQLRNCRSFKRERGSVISFVGDDARTSVFIASQRAVVPGSLKLQAKDIKGVPNIYVPQYRELNIPAVVPVATASTTVSSGHSTTTFTTVGNQPLFPLDYFAYGQSADDADFAGPYRVKLYVDSTTGLLIAPPIPNQFNAAGGPATAMATTGGYLGTEQSRFKQYAPTVVQHRAAQQSGNQVSPGLRPFPRVLKVFYDLGNNTFDQTNRLMQWMRTRDLGPDVTPYVPPIAGTISVYADAVDVNGNCVGEIESCDVITLDATTDPVFAGDYVVGPEITDYMPAASQASSGKGSTRSFALQTYQPTAYPDTSMPPGDSYLTLSQFAFPTSDSLVSNAYYFMQATPTGGVTSTGYCSVSINDLTIWWMGQPAPTTYGPVGLPNIPIGSHVILYLQISSYGGAAPVLSMDTVAAHPPVPLAPGQIVIFSGIITAGTTGTTGIIAFGHLAGGSSLSPATLTPDVGYFGLTPTGAPPPPS